LSNHDPIQSGKIKQEKRGGKKAKGKRGQNEKRTERRPSCVLGQRGVGMTPQGNARKTKKGKTMVCRQEEKEKKRKTRSRRREVTSLKT